MSDPDAARRDDVHLDEHDTLPPSMDPAVGEGVEEPPTDVLGIFKRLGPGLIIAGSIVGSGELIATTKTGAQAGIALLWLIVIGCLIKVFVQVELGRYAITHGETTLAALDRLPGPRLGVNWVMWLWLVMAACTIGQLGGIVGGVGQSLAMTVPITGDYRDAILTPSADEIRVYDKWDDQFLSEFDLHLRAHHPDGANTASDAQEEWVAATNERTETLLDALEASGRQAVLDAFQALETTYDDGTVDERQDAREALRSELDAANLARLERVDESDPEKLRTLADSSDDQHHRVVHGHGILASQLTDLDRHGERAISAIVAVEEVRQAEARLKEEQEGFSAFVPTTDDVHALRKARQQVGFAEAEVEHAKERVKVLLEPWTLDDKYWAAGVTVVTVVLLVLGRYNLIQNISLVLVVSFTFITIGNVVSLQAAPEFRISTSDFLRGLSFGAPEKFGTQTPWLTALATFGIIGVGASELIAYPYWCLEKGYAKWTGVRRDDEAWTRRAKGWLRVMRWDAFASMVVYTIATVAFYVMGVAVLYNEGRDPDGMRMVSTLATAYVPVFGEYAKWLFLGGAIAVLYSTFLVANAGNARMMTDAFKVVGLVPHNEERSHRRTLGVFSALLPLTCLTIFWSGANPVTVIMVAGAMQAFMLPIIGFGAIWFRYKMTDARLKPTPLWDLMLLVSCLGLLLAGGYGVFRQFGSFFG